MLYAELGQAVRGRATPRSGGKGPVGKETSAQVGSWGLEPEEKDEGEELATGPCLHVTDG